MNETGDIVSNLPAIMLLSFWWAFLTTLDLIFRPGGFGQAENAGTPADAAKPSADPRLRELLALDPGFDAESFLRGARRAYEQIVLAYAAQDAGILRPLVSEEVLEAFLGAGAARRERGETMELTFVGIDSAAIETVEVAAEAARISVLFHAEVVAATRSSTGETVEGDPSAVTLVADLWTFARPPADGDAPWTLVATDRG